eukprot:TRINITY_DN11523_c0_g1_i1.p1 TRINITY_DN11523_c0_g1~~TRINITY_DN11523_c0_g1_i1.p1  ORF type:complete len:186 (+),score=-16.28 TRINITY_DN11523_c0_g1_i1:334-891(+)
MQHTNTYVQQYSDTTQQKKQTPQKITASIIKNISMKTFAFLLTRKKECTISITSPHIFIEKHIKKNSTIVTKNCIVTLSMIQKILVSAIHCYLQEIHNAKFVVQEICNISIPMSNNILIQHNKKIKHTKNNSLNNKKYKYENICLPINTKKRMYYFHHVNHIFLQKNTLKKIVQQLQKIALLLCQ